MGNVSTEWLAAISTGRDYSIDEKKKGCAVPVTPWLHPPVGKRLRDLITKLGTVRELERQEILYPHGRKVSDIVLVQQGVTARNFGTPFPVRRLPPSRPRATLPAATSIS